MLQSARLLSPGECTLTGTFINVGAVLVGGTIGALAGGWFSTQIRVTLLQAVGLTTLAIGAQRVIGAENPLILLASVVLGGLLGELLQIERGLEKLGAWAPRKLGGDAKARNKTGTRPVANGFVTASLIFCVGPMTILGSFEDGLSGAYQTLALKATLDGLTAALLASTLGWGVLLASITILCYQGALTLSAGLLRSVLSDGMIHEMTAVGGLLILAIGLNLLEVSRIRVGSLLPALAVAPLLVALTSSRGG